MKYIFRFNAMKHSRNEYQQFWTQKIMPFVANQQSPKIMQSRINYIHQNPVRAGWVEVEEHFLLAVQRLCRNRKGLVNVELA